MNRYSKGQHLFEMKIALRVVLAAGKPNGHEQVVQIYDLGYQSKHSPLHGASALFCWSELCMLVWLHTGSQKSISQAQSSDQHHVLRQPMQMFLNRKIKVPHKLYYSLSLPNLSLSGFFFFFFLHVIGEIRQFFFILKDHKIAICL